VIEEEMTPGLLVGQRTIPTERPPLVGEVSANFSGEKMLRGQRNESPWPLISVFWTGEEMTRKELDCAKKTSYVLQLQ
jgi:hypothetical protein